MAVWTVKGGAKGVAEEACLSEGLIGKGGHVSSLANANSRDEITAMWIDSYPEMSKQQTASHVVQALVAGCQDEGRGTRRPTTSTVLT